MFRGFESPNQVQQAVSGLTAGVSPNGIVAPPLFPGFGSSYIYSDVISVPAYATTTITIPSDSDMIVSMNSFDAADPNKTHQFNLISSISFRDQIGNYGFVPAGGTFVYYNNSSSTHRVAYSGIKIGNGPFRNIVGAKIDNPESSPTDLYTVPPGKMLLICGVGISDTTWSSYLALRDASNNLFAARGFMNLDSAWGFGIKCVNYIVPENYTVVAYGTAGSFSFWGTVLVPPANVIYGTVGVNSDIRPQSGQAYQLLSVYGSGIGNSSALFDVVGASYTTTTSDRWGDNNSFGSFAQNYTFSPLPGMLGLFLNNTTYAKSTSSYGLLYVAAVY